MWLAIGSLFHVDPSQLWISLLCERQTSCKMQLSLIYTVLSQVTVKMAIMAQDYKIYTSETGHSVSLARTFNQLSTAVSRNRVVITGKV